MPLSPHPGPVCEVAAWTLGGGPRAAMPPSGYRWVILQRHGRRPLAVPGRALLRGDNRCADLPWWSAVTIYEIAVQGPAPDGVLAGAFAAAVSHTFRQNNGLNDQPPWCDAWIADGTDTLRATLDRHDPLRAMPADLPPAARDGFLAASDALAWRVQGAWAGLLGALFGLHAPPGTVRP